MFGLKEIKEKFGIQLLFISMTLDVYNQLWTFNMSSLKMGGHLLCPQYFLCPLLGIILNIGENSILTR